MDNIKDIVITKIAADICTKYQIDTDEIKSILYSQLEGYEIANSKDSEKSTELSEKIEYFLGVRRLDGLSDKTLRQYKSELNMMARYITKPVAEITITDLRGYFAKIQQKRHLQKTTLNNKITAIHSFFGFLHEEDMIPKDPSRKLKTQKIDMKSLREALNMEELEIFRNACKNIREKMIVEFLYSSGCRASEALNVRISNIDWNERALTVHGKGDKNRLIFFSVKAKLYMKQYISERKCESDFLFVSERAPYLAITNSCLERIIRSIASRTNIKKTITPHVLRHTFATIALSRGMSIELIQQLLGHSSVNTTQIYAETSLRAIKSAYEQHMAA